MHIHNIYATLKSKYREMRDNIGTIATYVQEERELPPILMFHGTNDELVPFGQGCELFQALTAAKKDATFYQVIGAHHGGREFWSKEVLDIEEQFIRRLCK